MLTSSPLLAALYPPLLFSFLYSCPTQRNTSLGSNFDSKISYKASNRPRLGKEGNDGRACTQNFALLPIGTNQAFALLCVMPCVHAPVRFPSIFHTSPRPSTIFLPRHERLVRLRHSLQRTRRDRHQRPRAEPKTPIAKRIKTPSTLQEIWYKAE